jgi:hypothetical protein
VRVLLDSCVPRQLKNNLPGHEVRTAPEMGWGDFDDGPLLDAMADRFDALITVDKSLPKQQDLNARLFGVILLRAKSNRLVDLLPLLPELIEILDSVNPGEVRELGV